MFGFLVFWFVWLFIFLKKYNVYNVYNISISLHHLLQVSGTNLNISCLLCYFQQLLLLISRDLLGVGSKKIRFSRGFLLFFPRNFGVSRSFSGFSGEFLVFSKFLEVFPKNFRFSRGFRFSLKVYTQSYSRQFIRTRVFKKKKETQVQNRRPYGK